MELSNKVVSLPLIGEEFREPLTNASEPWSKMFFRPRLIPERTVRKGDWVKKGQIICSFNVMIPLIALLNRPLIGLSEKIPIISPVNGRVLYFRDMSFFNGSIDKHMGPSFFTVQISNEEQVPHTAASAFEEFRSIILGCFGPLFNNYHWITKESIKNRLNELMDYKLVPTEANEEQKKIIEWCNANS